MEGSKMNLSPHGIIELVGHEAIVLNRYKDTKGIWTIGIGHTQNAGIPNPHHITGTLSLNEVIDIFIRDVKSIETRVQKAFTRTITQHQFDAAVSFDFNTGAIDRAKWVQHFNCGNIKKSKYAFMQWRKPKEIINRRQYECKLFFEGKYSSTGWVNIYNAGKNGKIIWKKGKRIRLPKQIIEKITQSQKTESRFKKMIRGILWRK